MKLIVILLCLWLDHYMHVGSRGRQLQYFNHYEKFLKKHLGSSQSWQGPLSLVIIAAPILVIVGVLQLLGMFRSDLLELILDVAVLLFCLGATPLQAKLESYLAPKSEKAHTTQADLEAYMKEAGVKGHASFHRHVTQLVFSQSHERVFAVIFWFLILGPIGAIIYRLISWFHDNAYHGDSMYDAQLEHISIVHHYAAWIPARLVALSYTLVGNFMASFDIWFKSAMNPKVSQEILVECGDASLGVSATPANTATKAENESALHLVQRALFVWVLIIAVATLGQLFL